MKKALLSLSVSAQLALFAMTANASVANDENTLPTSSTEYNFKGDSLPPLSGASSLPYLELLEKKRIKESLVSGQADADTVQRILVFYQPSYADKFGLDVIHQRIENSVLRDYQYVAGDTRTIKIVDILPLTSVPDNLPYEDRYDQSGDLISLGYNYNNAGEGDIFNILDVPLDEDRPESVLMGKYAPDLVMIFRDRRPEESSVLGLARVTGVNSLIFDSGTNLINPSEDNLLTQTVSHELGHNHGLSHEVSGDETEVGSDGEYTSNHATQCGDAVTVMWSTAGGYDAVKFYSSPDKYHKGEVCGYEGGQGDVLNGADNQSYFDLYMEYAHSWSNTMFDSPDNAVSFIDDNLSIGEDEGSFTITLTRTGDLNEEAHVYVRAAADSEAKYPQDIQQYKQQAYFAAGESEAQVTFDLVYDNLDEGTEQLLLELVYPYLTDATEEQLTVKVLNRFIPEEDRGQIWLKTPMSVAEGEVGYIEFARDADSVGDVVVSLRPDYHLFEDTGLELFEDQVSDANPAVEGIDYIMPSSVVLMKQGETSLRVPVETMDDLDPELTEGISMSFSTLTGDDVLFEDSSKGAMLIEDDDAVLAGTLAIEFNGEGETIEESDGYLDFTVYRDMSDEGGIPFSVSIAVDYGSDIPPIETTLYSSFEERMDYEEVYDENGDLIESDAGKYEAVKYFTHSLAKTPVEYGDYKVKVTLTNLLEDGLVDELKSSIEFKVINNYDSGSLNGSSPLVNKEQSGGGSINIAYLLVLLGFAGMRRKKV
jgi:hypothetical protein